MPPQVDVDLPESAGGGQKTITLGPEGEHGVEGHPDVPDTEEIVVEGVRQNFPNPDYNPVRIRYTDEDGHEFVGRVKAEHVQ